jgi:AcrR family transcriptional regulator
VGRTAPSRRTDRPDKPETATLREIGLRDPAVRRRNGQEVPLGAKAARTRQNLMDSAREVFTEQGFLATSTVDIAERAGTSLATFYQYFPDLGGIVVALAHEQVKAMLAQHVDDWDANSGRLGLRRMVSAFVHGYVGNIDFYRVWEQVTAVDPRIAELRRAFWSVYKHRIDDSLASGVEAGVVRADLSTAEMARALTYLLERYCVDMTILDPPAEPMDLDDVIDLLTELWADAIRLVEHRS